MLLNPLQCIRVLPYLLAPLVWLSPAPIWATPIAQVAPSINPSGDPGALVQEGDRLSTERQYPAAIEQFQQALELYRARGDRQGEARVLSRLRYCWRIGQRKICTSKTLSSYWC